MAEEGSLLHSRGVQPVAVSRTVEVPFRPARRRFGHGQRRRSGTCRPAAKPRRGQAKLGHPGCLLVQTGTGGSSMAVSRAEADKPVMLPIETGRLLRDWEAAWGLEGLARQVSIDIRPSLRRSLACCEPARRVIFVSPRLLAGERRSAFAEALCHELAHLAVHLRHGAAAAPHGPEWRELVARAGFEPRRRLSFEPRPCAGSEARMEAGFEPHTRIGPARAAGAAPAVSRPRARVVYEHRCPVCQTAWTARKPMSAWRCLTCVRDGGDGRLSITSRPASTTSRPTRPPTPA